MAIPFPKVDSLDILWGFKFSGFEILFQKKNLSSKKIILEIFIDLSLLYEGDKIPNFLWERSSNNEYIYTFLYKI